MMARRGCQTGSVGGKRVGGVYARGAGHAPHVNFHKPRNPYSGLDLNVGDDSSKSTNN
jgi:hypothetical protein